MDHTTEPPPSSLSGKHKDRYFPRVSYRAEAALISTGQHWDVHVIDLSFNGALIALLQEHELKIGEEVILRLKCHNDEQIKMQGHIVHQQQHYLGIECHATGIDGQKQLRELLEEYQAATQDPANH